MNEIEFRVYEYLINGISIDVEKLEQRDGYFKYHVDIYSEMGCASFGANSIDEAYIDAFYEIEEMIKEENNL